MDSNVHACNVHRATGTRKQIRTLQCNTATCNDVMVSLNLMLRGNQLSSSFHVWSVVCNAALGKVKYTVMHWLLIKYYILKCSLHSEKLETWCSHSHYNSRCHGCHGWTFCSSRFQPNTLSEMCCRSSWVLLTALVSRHILSVQDILHTCIFVPP